LKYFVLADNPKLSGVLTVDAAFVPALESLFAYGCRITKFVFPTQLASLRLLSIANNSITTLEDIDFAALINLRSVYLHFNRIWTLPQQQIWRLPASLSTLSLEYNLIAALPSRLFSDNNLVLVSFQANYITSIASDAFAGMSFLSIINLHDNLLTSISPSTFASNPLLIKIDLSSNFLTELPVGLLRHLSDLESLNVGSNRLTFLHPDVFAGLHSLESLDLSFNSITTLNSSVFTPLTSLKSLLLARLPLTAIPPLFFASQRHLSFVFVSYFGIMAIPHRRQKEP
jgi:Leucine-rich repeat (LRR) protein